MEFSVSIMYSYKYWLLQQYTAKRKRKFYLLTCTSALFYLIYLFGVLRRFQHCTGHITTGSWKGRGNQYIQFVRVLYCKLPTNGKQLPAFPHEALPGIEPRPQRWEARVLPLCHRGPRTSALWIPNICVHGRKDIMQIWALSKATLQHVIRY